MSHERFTILVTLTISCFVGITFSQNFFCNGPFIFERHNSDCRKYRIKICSSGMNVDMPGCQEGAVFSKAARTCVREGTLYDDCPKQTPASDNLIPFAAPTQQAAGNSIEARCRRGEGPTFAHPTECGLFYNCKKIYNQIPADFEQYMDECEYPQLYNDRTGRCDDFRNVQCGARSEPRNHCDYRTNWCRTSHCIPCKLRFPSCEGASDGPNPYPGREWTPQYIECRGGRLLRSHACPSVVGSPNLFSSTTRRCESIIPQAVQLFGGEVPDCKAQGDGHYKDLGGECDTYMVCVDEKLEGSYKCPAGSVFDDHAQRCLDPSELCAPCGTRTDDC